MISQTVYSTTHINYFYGNDPSIDENNCIYVTINLLLTHSYVRVNFLLYDVHNTYTILTTYIHIYDFRHKYITLLTEIRGLPRRE